jgi:hypothetical protein
VSSGMHAQIRSAMKLQNRRPTPETPCECALVSMKVSTIRRSVSRCRIFPGSGMYANTLTCVETESSYKNGCGVYGLSGRLELLWVE